MGNIIHKTLCRKTYLGNSIASHGSCCRTVGINGISLSTDIRTGILQSAGSQSIGCNGMSMGCISSLVRICGHFFCQKMAFLIYTGFHIIFNRVTGSGIGKCLFPCQLNFHRSAAYLHGEKSIQRLIKHFLLISKSTTYIRLDHTYLSPWDSQCLSYYTTDNVGDLSRRYHNDPAFFHICIGNIILNMAMLDNGCLIASFQLNRCLFHGLIHISDCETGTGQNIVFFINMNGMLTPSHGNPWTYHNRIFLIFHFDQLQRTGGSHFILCHNCCNIIAIITNSSSEQISICHVLMSQLHRPGMSWCGIAMIRYVLKGNHLYYAVQSLSLTGINGFHNTVSNLRMINLGYQTLI